MSTRSSFLIALCLLGCSCAGSAGEVDANTYAGAEYGSGGDGGSTPEGGDGGSGGWKASPVCGNGLVKPNDSFEYGEHCYVVGRTPSNWETSFASCQDLGMHLAS